MVSPLAAMNIGSPLPDHADQIARKIIDGEIEILDNLFHMHALSQMKLQSLNELGLSTLQGSWLYTPKYMRETKLDLSYTIGHMQSTPQESFRELAQTLISKAEQEFYYRPLTRLRAFLINHDKESGKTDLRMPEHWRVTFDDKLSMRDFVHLFESYVTSEQTGEVTEFIYEKFFCQEVQQSGVTILHHTHGLREIPHTHLEQHLAVPDLTSLFKFLLTPIGHGLNQEKLQAYLRAINL